MTAPTVSAVMAAYNAAATIESAVRSVLDQTLASLELLVVDDGSTDGTADVLARIADPRLRVLRLPLQAGRAAARNAALAEARGRYVAICDADDLSLPERFQRQAAFLDDAPDHGVVGAQLLHRDDDGRTGQVYRWPASHARIRARFARGQMAVPHAASMIRTDLLRRVGGYAVECRRAQDLELFLRALPHTRMANLDQPLVVYRRPSRTPLQYWLRSGTWRRYAVHRVNAAATGDVPLRFDEFRRRPEVLAGRVWDCASYLRSHLHQALLGTRSL